MFIRRLEMGIGHRPKTAGIVPPNGMHTHPEMDSKSWPTEKSGSRAQMATAAVLSLLTGGLYPRQAE
jgi:hypothetical protein